jgi:RHS repeat-associated protein
MAARLTRLVIVLALTVGVVLPASAAAAVVRLPTSQKIAASPVPARGADPVYARSYFGARYYRADVGRFTTVDPVQTISENLTDPQRWNRYSYVRNNPLRYTDPDGRLPVEPWKASGHTDLTTAAMSGQGGLSSQDVARAVEANIAVDALSNQTNDPAHYMPGTGAEATKLIDQLLDTAVKAEVGGRHSEAMKALGQALHTVQDRYAHDAQNAGWLAHMNGSAPDNPAKHPKEYQDAKRASQEFVQRYLAEVKKKRESEPNSSPEKR